MSYQTGFQAPPLTKISKGIMILCGSLFVLNAISQAVGAFSLMSWLALSTEGLLSGKVFQLLVYPFMETQLLTLVFNLLVIWFLGGELETHLGPRIYGRFLVLCLFLTGLIFIAMAVFFLDGSKMLYGLSGMNYALCIGYAMIFPDRKLSFMFFFPLQAKHFCWLMAGIEMYFALVGGNLSTAWAHLFSMGVAYLVIRYQANWPWRWWFNWSLPSGGKRSKSSHLKLVRPDSEDKPKYWH